MTPAMKAIFAHAQRFMANCELLLKVNITFKKGHEGPEGE